MSTHKVRKELIKRAQSYGKSNSGGTPVHTLHVKLRAEKGDLACSITIGFHSFEDSLCIMKNGAARFK
jgi:hypothetical protein